MKPATFNMRATLSICLMLTLTSCSAPRPLPAAPQVTVCPTIPAAWLEVTYPPPELPETYGDLRLYTIELMGQLARCNAHKTAIKERVE